jgi:16S rRNA (cytidine1402-2'-O)-methyltransferase
MPGRLYLCATPIGNLGDASPRLAETLAGVDLVFAEDTRRSATLLNALGVKVPLRSFFAGNESQRSDEMAEEMAAGRTVALVTDAGTPAVSDPGVLAVAAARRVGAEVIVIPGPSAVTAAVAGSGMVEGPFVFQGFLERKGRARRDQLAQLSVENRPTVLFLSPHRVASDLSALIKACGGERLVCVARELTKIHEEFWWGSLAEAAARWGEESPRGEFTVVIAGAEPIPMTLDQAVELAKRLVGEGVPPSRAARETAAGSGLNRREIYQRIISP